MLKLFFERVLEKTFKACDQDRVANACWRLLLLNAERKT